MTVFNEEFVTRLKEQNMEDVLEALDNMVIGFVHDQAIRGDQANVIWWTVFGKDGSIVGRTGNVQEVEDRQQIRKAVEDFVAQGRYIRLEVSRPMVRIPEHDPEVALEIERLSDELES